MADYAEMENPGPEEAEEASLRPAGQGRAPGCKLATRWTGNSHKPVPELHEERRELVCDLITVDRDHARRARSRI